MPTLYIYCLILLLLNYWYDYYIYILNFHILTGLLCYFISIEYYIISPLALLPFLHIVFYLLSTYLFYILVVLYKYGPYQFIYSYYINLLPSVLSILLLMGFAWSSSAFLLMNWWTLSDKTETLLCLFTGLFIISWHCYWVTPQYYCLLISIQYWTWSTLLFLSTNTVTPVIHISLSRFTPLFFLLIIIFLIYTTTRIPPTLQLLNHYVRPTRYIILYFYAGSSIYISICYLYYIQQLYTRPTLHPLLLYSGLLYTSSFLYLRYKYLFIYISYQYVYLFTPVLMPLYNFLYCLLFFKRFHYTLHLYSFIILIIYLFSIKILVSSTIYTYFFLSMYMSSLLVYLLFWCYMF